MREGQEGQAAEEDEEAGVRGRSWRRGKKRIGGNEGGEGRKREQKLHD